MTFAPFPFIFALFVLVLIYRLSSKPKRNYLAELPEAIDSKGFVTSFKNRLQNSVGDVNSVLAVGYAKFSRLDKSFYLPGFHSDYVILPPSEVKWIIQQPDHIMSPQAEQNKSIQMEWTFLDKAVHENPIQNNVVRREMTRQINSLIPAVQDELDLAVVQYLGDDQGEWRDICVFESMMKVIARVTNRIFVGKQICRKDEFLRNSALFTQDITLTATLLRFFPEWTKSVLAPIVTLPTRYHVRQCSKYLMPLVKSRLANINQIEDEDCVTWCIREAAASSCPEEELKPNRIVLRIMTMNFAAIHTSTFTATNLLLDLYSSPSAELDIATLRAEIEEVYISNGNKWDKASLARLVKTDSALRESLRISTFMTHGMDRAVIAKSGVTTPSGLHLSQGTSLGTSTYAIHHDDDIYPSADTFQPFRFSEARESLLPVSSSTSTDPQFTQESRDKLLESRNLAAVTTNDHFLAFGAGKHACPGRFFATAEIKMMLASIIMNYDVEPIKERPLNKVYGPTIVPPMKATMRIRRRVTPV